MGDGSIYDIKNLNHTHVSIGLITNESEIYPLFSEICQKFSFLMRIAMNAKDNFLQNEIRNLIMDFVRCQSIGIGSLEIILTMMILYNETNSIQALERAALVRLL